MAKKNPNESSNDRVSNPGSQGGKSTSDKNSGKSEARRDFMKTTVASGLGICAVGTPFCAGTRAVIDPVFQEGQEGKFYPLTTVDTLTDKPQKFSIVDNKTDAWTTIPNQKIGSVFLRKVGDQIEAFHALCPHDGCVVLVGVKKNPKTEVEEDLFYCPCHAAHFTFDGKRLDEVSPRDLDTLEVKVEGGVVSVKFENFVFGIAEKRV